LRKEWGRGKTKGEKRGDVKPGVVRLAKNVRTTGLLKNFQRTREKVTHGQRGQIIEIQKKSQIEQTEKETKAWKERKGSPKDGGGRGRDSRRVRENPSTNF